ncbi:unnamed protein product [Meloidogyne enterolobii]|uniref:Uncharacterized protein n=1 Tax=Meloidogyne enterolobii TaxID=390850 RepID=A0ACB0ZJ33_MELEN
MKVYEFMNSSFDISCFSFFTLIFLSSFIFFNFLLPLLLFLQFPINFFLLFFIILLFINFFNLSTNFFRYTCSHFIIFIFFLFFAFINRMGSPSK